MIYFLHVHKGGGTYLVDHARENAVLFHEEANGNPMQDGGLIPFWTWGIREQLEFLRGARCDFVSNEACIGNHFFVEAEIRYVTIIRDPLDRTYSHFRHEMQAFESGAPDVDDYVQFAAGKGFAYFCENLLAEINWANDYTVKQLGLDNLRKYAVPGDLRLAMSRLSSFAVVGIFDRMSAQSNIMSAFGWKAASQPFTRDIKQSARRALADHPKALTALLEAHKFDLQLYNWCLQLARRDDAIRYRE